MPATRSMRGNGRRFVLPGCVAHQTGAGKQKRRRKAPFCMVLEAEVGIEPAYTALQAAA